MQSFLSFVNYVLNRNINVNNNGMDMKGGEPTLFLGADPMSTFGD